MRDSGLLRRTRCVHRRSFVPEAVRPRWQRAVPASHAAYGTAIAGPADAVSAKLQGGGGEAMDATIDARLRRAGLKLSGPRRAVVEAMERENCCLDAHEIFMRLRAAGQKTGLTSVYRVLDLLQSLGLAAKIDFGAGTYKYELTKGGHHHHVVCSDCGSVGVFD